MGTDGDKFDNSDDDSKSETVYARLIFTDGTIVKVETDAKKSEINGLRNQWSLTPWTRTTSIP